MRRTGRVLGALLDRAERRIGWVQGKGYGTATVAHEVAAIRDVLAGGPPVRVVVDVGANVGDWTAEALRAFPAAQVHAFEPSATCVGVLRARYGSEPRVHLTAAAVGAEAGSATLFSDAPGSGLASLSRRDLKHVGLSMDQEQTVEVVTLDAALPAADVDHVDVLKIDVEGHELDVLKGAAHLLATTRVVQFEFGGTQIDTRTFFRDYWYLLTDAGFAIHRIGPWSLRRVERYREAEESFLTTNFLAVRER